MQVRVYMTYRQKQLHDMTIFFVTRIYRKHTHTHTHMYYNVYGSAYPPTHPHPTEGCVGWLVCSLFLVPHCLSHAVSLLLVLPVVHLCSLYFLLHGGYDSSVVDANYPPQLLELVGEGTSSKRLQRQMRYILESG